MPNLQNYHDIVYIGLTNMSPYRTAIDSTTQTIEQRTKYYRNLIVAVVIIGVSSLAWTLIAGNFLALSGLALLFPVCGLFFVLDCKLLNEWRSRLFEPWVKRELDFRYFLDAVGAITTLPKDTVIGMLDTLPTSDNILEEQALNSTTRETIAMVISALDACRSDGLAWKTVMFAIAACTVIAVLSLWHWQPLLFLLSLPLITVLDKGLQRKRLKRVQNALMLAVKNPEFNDYAFRVYAAALNWSLIAPALKEWLLVVNEPADSSFVFIKGAR